MRHHLRARSFHDHLALVQDGDTLGEGERDVEVVLDHDHRDPARDGGELVLDLAPLFLRETRERLVEEQHARLLRQGHGDLYAALLAVGGVGQAPVGGRAQPDPVQHGQRALPQLGSSGMKMNGPYDYVPPNYWYDKAHSDLGGAWGFNSETSAGPDIPTMDTLKRMLSSSELDTLWKNHLYSMDQLELP